MTEASATRSTPSRLTLEAIVDAAAELIEVEGFEALTMRRLAERCGVGTMTLYGHVRTKEELLGALADRLLAEVAPPRDGSLEWQDQVTEIYRSVRATFLEHPELTQIVAGQPIDGLAAYRGAEVVFAALEGAGLTDLDAVAAFETLTSFTLGFTLREVAREPRPDQTGVRWRRLRALPADEFTRVAGLAGLLAARDSDRHFEQGLAMVIRGIGDPDRRRA